MNSRIEYVLEDEIVEYPFVEIPNDPIRRTDDELKEMVAEELRKQGIEVGDLSKLTLRTGDGVTNNDGISESLSFTATLVGTEQRRVPYRVEEERVDEGVLPEYISAKSKEEKDQYVLEELRKVHPELDESEIEIVYVGAVDSDEIDDMPLEGYEIYHVKRTRLKEEELSTESEKTSNVDPAAVEKELTELIELRNKLENAVSADEIERLVREAYDKVDTIDNALPTLEINDSLEEELKNIEKEIQELQKKVKDSLNAYDQYHDSVKELIEGKSKALDNTNTLLSEEEIGKVLNDYNTKLLEENQKSIALKKQLEEQKKLLTRLKSRRTTIQKTIDGAKDMGVSLNSYAELSDAMRKKNIMNAILERKGFDDIAEKKASDRTKEEKQTLIDAKKEIMHEIIEAHRKDETRSIIDTIEALYNIQIAYQGKTPKALLINEEDLNHIRDEVSHLPERVVVDSKDTIPNYVPGPAPKDLVDDVATKKKTINDKFIARGMFAFDLIGLSPEEIERKKREEAIKDLASQGIEFDEDTMELVFDGATTTEEASDIQYEQYSVYSKTKEDTDVDANEIGDEPEEPDRSDEVDEPEDELYNGPGLMDRYTLYKDKSTGEVYVRKAVLARFNVIPMGGEVEIDGAYCYRISEESAQYIENNKDNDVSPYLVETVEVDLYQYGPGLIDRYTLYEDRLNGDVYVRKPVLSRFNITPIGDEVNINGIPCFRISSEDAEYIEDNKDNDLTPYLVERELVDIKKDTIDYPDVVVEERVILYRNKDDYSEVFANRKVLNRFSLTPLGDKITIQGEECYRLTTEEEDAIKGYALSSTNPKIVVEYVDVELEKEKDVIDEDVITIYQDVDDPDMFFATKEILDRFGITPTSSVIKIAGKDLYLISVDEHDQIKQLASESVDPRISIEYEPIQREKETIVLFENSQDPSDIFASIDILSRFGITPSGTSESIFGLESYPISADIVQTIKDLANKSINPIITVEMRKFEKKIEDTIENVDITLYRDLSDNNQIYATDEVLERFYIPPVGATTNVNGEDCYKISNDAHEMIKGIAKNSYNPKINIHYVDVRLKKPEKHYLKILDEVTTGLTIGRKDAKRYYAFHSDPLGGFLSDIHSGNYMYNIVHVLSGVVPLAGGLLNKYASRLLSSEKGRKVIAELENRLRNLPEEELEVLFRDYRGSELKQNMNVAINDVILRVLRDYGMKKVAKLNAEIKGYYKALYPLLLQIQELNKKLDRGVFKDDAEREACLQARKTLCDQAGPLIIKIEDARSKANHLLSDGIHGMEEDFKAVATKLSYVGMRFAKTYDYDNELSAQLGRFGQGLKDSMHSNDNVGIVENFMNLEHCYYSNSETRKSIFGERSTGKKYYTPLAVPFDYRDDPFLKDLFASIAIATSVVSAVNAFRTHVTESRRLLQQQQQMANQANAQNAQAIGYARQVGQQIEGKRGAFQEGMEAQIYQAAHANGTGLERAAMDEFGWGNFDSAYHAADAANHATYNSFFDQASSGITQVAIQRGQGLITEAQALQQLARIANNCQAQSNHIINQCLNVLKPYAASHPQFDLHGIQQAMQYVVNHPNAIANMNQAAVDVTDLAGTLSGLTAAQVTALSHLPSDMLTTFLGSVASLAFVHRVTDDMSKSAAFTGANKGRAVQENDEEMADMFDELYGDREETAHKRR